MLPNLAQPPWSSPTASRNWTRFRPARRWWWLVPAGPQTPLFRPSCPASLYRALSPSVNQSHPNTPTQPNPTDLTSTETLAPAARHIHTCASSLYHPRRLCRRIRVLPLPLIPSPPFAEPARLAPLHDPPFPSALACRLPAPQAHFSAGPHTQTSPSRRSSLSHLKRHAEPTIICPAIACTLPLVVDLTPRLAEATTTGLSRPPGSAFFFPVLSRYGPHACRPIVSPIVFYLRPFHLAFGHVFCRLGCGRLGTA